MNGVAGEPSLSDRAPFRSDLSNNNVPVTVRGKVPAWLSGSLIRSAPAVFERQHFIVSHWFDGLGMLYAFRFENGSVQYQQRLMETEAELQTRTGRLRLATFATPLERSLLRRALQPIPTITDNTNVNVVNFGSDIVALSEVPTQWVVDRETLRCASRVSYEDRLGAAMMIAHPHYDFHRKKIVNVATEIGPKTSLQIYEHGPNERSRHVIGKINVSRLPYVHSFGLTPKHAILIAHPFDLNPMGMLWSNRGLVDHMQYRPHGHTKFWLVSRENGEVREHNAPAGFVFHVLNAFERGSETVIDVASYADPSIVDALSYSSLMNGLPSLRPKLIRYTFDPRKSDAQREVLLEDGFEFPTINYRMASGEEHQCSWGANFGSDGSTLFKRDKSGKTFEMHEANWVFGEPVVHGRPNATVEDDAVILTVGSHMSEPRSQLRILDAASMDVIATLEVPIPIPLGFHGNFFSS